MELLAAISSDSDLRVSRIYYYKMIQIYSTDRDASRISRFGFSPHQYSLLSFPRPQFENINNFVAKVVTLVRQI